MPIPATPSSSPADAITFAFGETVTRLRAPLVLDPYSKQTTRAEWDDEDNPADRELIHGVAFDPGGSLEPTQDGRGSVVTSPRLFVPSASDVGPHDRVEVDGVTYDVEGTPGRWRNPFTGSTFPLVVNLKLVEG